MDQELQVGEGGIRLDRFLARSLPGYSREHLKELIERGCVTVGGAAKPPDFRLPDGAVVNVAWPSGAWAEEPLEERVLFEDKHILALNKPAGLVVHPVGSTWLAKPEAAAGEAAPNLAGILYRQRPEIVRSGAERCGIVHRLDRDTSGVMVVAKTRAAQEALVGAFAERRVEKVYRAIVWGRLEGPVEVDAPIGRGPTGGRIQVSRYGRDSSTRFSVVESAARATVVEARPLTGRTHQIRAHLAHIDHPVLGDTEWTTTLVPRLEKAGMPKPPRLMLHAWKLAVPHPATGKTVRFSAPPPKDFKDYWRSLCSR